MPKFAAFILFFFSFAEVIATSLLNGPMLSDLTFREAQIWTQTEYPASVAVHYFEIGNPDETFITSKIQTTEANGCIANFSLTKIEPNRSYSYSIEIDGELSSKKYLFDSLNYYHEKEPPPDVKIAILGPHYGVEPEFEPPYRNFVDLFNLCKNNNVNPFFIDYGNVWHFTGFPIEWREEVMRLTWELVGKNYE